MVQRLFDGPFHPAQLVGVAGNEVLVRMAIAGVTVYDWQGRALVRDGFGGVPQSDTEQRVRHGPIGGELAAHEGAPARAGSVHLTRPVLTQPSRFATIRLRLTAPN